MRKYARRDCVRLESELVFGDAVDEVDLVVQREGPPAHIRIPNKPDQPNKPKRTGRKSSTHKHQRRRTATSRISSVQQGSSVYLRDGRCLSRALPETGSLRSDFTSCGRAPSAFCPRAAAIASLPLRRPVGSSAGAVVLDGSGNFASTTL